MTSASHPPDRDAPRDGEPVVTLENYTITYGKFTAVDSASFAMPRGACGLLGQNGAGKSSILKAVLGLVKPRSGKAVVLGFDAARESGALRDAVGYMPEKEAYLPGLSGLDAVVLTGRLSGLPAGVAKQRAHEVLWLVGLDEARYRNVASYSLGMKQKVKLASALVHDPQLLFLDEPTNGLDPEGRMEILELLRDLVAKGKSLILSSHILSDVESLCSHAVLIDGGRVIAQGAMEDLTRGQGRVYELRFVGPIDATRRALEARGLEHRDAASSADAAPAEAPLEPPSQDAGEPASAPAIPVTDELAENTLQVVLREDQSTSDLFEVIRGAGISLRAFERSRRSLSDVFLESVHGANGAKERA